MNLKLFVQKQWKNPTTTFYCLIILLIWCQTGKVCNVYRTDIKPFQGNKKDSNVINTSNKKDSNVINTSNKKDSNVINTINSEDKIKSE